MGLPHHIKISGGGSDASIIYAYGIPTIALCIGMENVHSSQEYITIKNLTALPQYLVEIVKAVYSFGK
jgi:tripeptide aminopeptidase